MVVCVLVVGKRSNHWPATFIVTMGGINMANNDVYEVLTLTFQGNDHDDAIQYAAAWIRANIDTVKRKSIIREETINGDHLVFYEIVGRLKDNDIFTRADSRSR